MRTNRDAMLANWAGYLADAARSGVLTGKVCPISRIETIAGPRAGALEIFAGLESGRLLRTLSKNDAAALRQFVPWQFPGDPQIYMSGRYVRCEAGWPDDLAESMIRLADMGKHPIGNGRWVAGRSETGATIVPGLNDKTPHWLASGATGSGKSVAMQAAMLQLLADPDNEAILIDGKMGESLKAIERLPGVVGPVAVDGPSARSALGFACAEMKRRYETGYHDGRLIVCIDEFQELTADVVVADLMRKLCAQGRAAGVHCLFATQHPVIKMFGDPSTRRNLTGKLALQVGDADASRVAVGGATPRADHLLGAGDLYLVGPGACHRVQGVYVDEQEITAEENGSSSWRFQRWPDYDAEAVGQELPAGQFVYTGDEIGVALVSAAHGEGRDLFTARMNDAGFGRPGYSRQKRLRELGEGALNWMQANRYTVCEQSANVQDDAVPIPVIPDVW